MNAIFLGGESISNKSWIEEVEKSLRNLFTETKVLDYDHWQNGGELINLDAELPKLTDLAKDFGDYLIFAKSIGAVLTARAIFEKKISPTKGFFPGAAYLVGERTLSDFPKWANNFSLPSIFISKTNDPVSPANPMQELLKRYNFQNYQFVEIPGDNHKYEDLDQIRKLVEEFIK